jgi:PAS domain S-box-containing protein
VNEAQAVKLENLEQHEAPCLLWDGDRLRIVWANEAGLKIFGAETLFDLIDRPFDRAEPGAALVKKLKSDLGAFEERRETFQFPSAGPSVQLSAICSLYQLQDGRRGVLLVGEDLSEPARAFDKRLAAEAFEALPFAAIVVGADGSLQQQNAAARELLGRASEPRFAAVLEEERAAKEFLERVGHARVASEIRSLTTMFGRREVRLTGRLIGNDLGEGQARVVAIEDVTERRALERSLLKHGKPYFQPVAMTEAASIAAKPAMAEDSVPQIIRSKLDSLKDAVIIARGGEVLWANAQALALCGAASVSDLKMQKALTKAISAGEDEVAISPKPGEELRFALMRSSVAWNKGAAMQVKLSARAHETKAHVAAVLPKVEAPPVPAKAAAPAEIASWKPDDAELSAILDTASDGIITLDSEGRIRSFSAGAEAIFGQRKAQVLGQAFTELLTPATRKVFRDYLAALSDSGLAAVFNDGREVTANVGDGKSLPLFLTISKMNVEKRDGEARPGFCAVVRDITQWKQTEAELREAKERAEQTSRQKSEFLARISHELRTPLNAILGFSEVMRLERFGKLQNEKYRDYVSDIHSSGAHLLSLINDLLDLSKVEAGKFELDFASVSLPEVTEHAIRLLGERAQQARVSIRRSFPADLPNVVADLRSMRQIMINLLSNAIKFTDPGGQVMVSGRTNKAGELILKVKDTGVGMSEDELKEALEPFRRITSVTRPDAEGTGLGLPLTKALTEANRANFSIASEPGKGTIVEIVYPTTRVLAD